MTPWNPGTIGPTATGVPERDRQTYNVDLAQNSRRRGPLQAEEGLGTDPAIPYSLVHGMADGYTTPAGSPNHNAPVLRKVADGQGIFGRTNPAPSWAVVDGATRAGFAQGASGTEQSVTASPFPFVARAGANQNTLAPTFGLNAGERAGTVYSKSRAPVDGGRGRRNEAEVR